MTNKVGDNLKYCFNCNKIKSLDDFNKKLSGYSHYCSICSKDREQIRRKKYPWKLTFTHIKQRCNNPNNLNYKDYGGRGIKCLITENELKELWFRDKAYLMKQPTIDREDNDGHYEFDNCQFLENIDNIKKAHCKPVLQYDLNGKFIREWESGIKPRRQLNIYHIDLVIKGIRKTAGGFKWRYKYEN